MKSKFEFDEDRAFHYLDEYNDYYLLNYEEVGGCCGARLLYNFTLISMPTLITGLKDSWKDQVDDLVDYKDFEGSGYSKPRMPSNKYFESLLIERVKEDIQEIDRSSRLLRIAILNGTQNSWIGKILKSLGWRLVSDKTVNPSTGNRLYLYVNDPETPKKKLKKKTKRFK